MPVKKSTAMKQLKSAPKNTPDALKGYARVLATIRADPRYKSKTFHEQQQIASKIYHKL